jgi:hypothetical protein
MADEALPLSRRERREMEERAAAGVEPVAETDVAPSGAREPAPTSTPEPVEQDAALSRRDRRRLERLEQPMETWTAVEEMHHTGQVPTMTPEVIAQQEELARRRAAEAQADAVRATGEIHQVGAHQITPGAIERVTGEEPAISRFDMPDEAPRATGPSASEVPHATGDEARRLLAQAAAAAAASLPTDRERPPGPAQGHARQEHGILDAPRPPTSEVPALVDLTPPAGVPGVRLAGPPAAQSLPAQATQAQAPSAIPGGAPVAPPQQDTSGQGTPFPPSGAVPGVLPPVGPTTVGPTTAGPTTAGPTPAAPTPAGVAPAGVAPTSPAVVVGQVVPGAPQFPAFGPPTEGVPAQAALSPYPPGMALSPVATGTLHPVLGQTGTMRAIPGGGPMTGTIPRPLVEVQPAGGAKDFGWPHIAVLAAVAFTLGIVVWTISGLGG